MLSRGDNVCARLLRSYGIAEIAIGVLGLLFPVLFSGVRRLSIAIPHFGEAGSFTVDVFLTTILIGPATILMGATVPFLTQGLTRSDDEATRTHALVYGLNTVGAFCGAILAGYVLIPRNGLVGTTLGMGMVNVVTGSVYVVLSSRVRGGVHVERSAITTPESQADANQKVFIGVAFLCGLLIGEPTGDSPQVDVSGGEQVLELYHSLYNHTMPFSPEALRQTLSKCVPEAGRTIHDCRQLQAKVARLLEQGELEFTGRAAPAKLTLDSPARSAANLPRDAG